MFYYNNHIWIYCIHGPLQCAFLNDVLMKKSYYTNDSWNGHIAFFAETDTGTVLNLCCSWKAKCWSCTGAGIIYCWAGAARFWVGKGVCNAVTGWYGIGCYWRNW